MAGVGRILLVDDDDDLRAVIITTLEMEGYEVEEAWNCGTALSLLGRRTYDLVLLDITLPDDSGFRVLEYINESRRPIPVIMTTGTSGLDNALKSITLGAQDYITKPYNPNYLVKAIEHALEGKNSKESIKSSG